MSGTTVTMRRVRPTTVGLWAAQVLLAAGFVSGGMMKLAGSAVMVEMFADIGAGQWFRYVVGALELAGGIGVLVPRLCGPAALGLVGVMAGAIVNSVFVLSESPAPPLGYLVMAALVAWFRRSTIRALIQAVVQR